jgi:hypothetical protein
MRLDPSLIAADAMHTVSECFDMACDKARIAVESMARAVLRARSDLGEFVMGMGTACFTSNLDKDTFSLEEIEEATDLEEFISEWDRRLRITGDPMRFTATGKIVTEW